MIVFHVFPKYKKKKKIIEIIEKRIHLFEDNIINLPRMRKSNQNRVSPRSNGLLNFAHTF
jgi:hypothetical protein